jgi:predicted acetyltransferase
MQLRIRRASASDARAIAVVTQESRRASMPYLPVLYTFEQVVSWVRETMIPSYQVWIAQIDDDVAGFIAFRDEELDQLYVAPAHWTQGIGSSLLQVAKERSRCLRLYTFQRNERARTFYERHGFKLLRLSDGSKNEESEPDAYYEWSRPLIITDFRELGDLIDGDLRLAVKKLVPADPVKGWCPAYCFEMLSNGQPAGDINLRLGDAQILVMFAGQIGYNVAPEFRGRHYAARSVRLLLPVARAHGIDPLWITCNPDNIASRRSCEIAGGELVGIVELPQDCDMYRAGERQKCRYQFATERIEAERLNHSAER